MGLYAPQLAHYFGEVPSRDIGLIASEGRMSIALRDGSPEGVLAVTGQFFEFIPADEYGTVSPTVLCTHEVREGEEYFLLLTNASGLYRYDIGDRVRVTGWSGEAPVVEFLSRDAHSASMAGEKLTEDQVVLAMQRACYDGIRGPSSISEASIEFVLAPRFDDPPHYRLYVETGAPVTSEQFDAALCAVNGEYAGKRRSLRLGMVRRVELPAGALARRDAALRAARSRTAEQFKHQYLLPKPGLDADLAAQVVAPERARR
jgi:hypothetical protein